MREKRDDPLRLKVWQQDDISGPPSNPKRAGGWFLQDSLLEYLERMGQVKHEKNLLLSHPHTLPHNGHVLIYTSWSSTTHQYPPSRRCNLAIRSPHTLTLPSFSPRPLLNPPHKSQNFLSPPILYLLPHYLENQSYLDTLSSAPSSAQSASVPTIPLVHPDPQEQNDPSPLRYRPPFFSPPSITQVSLVIALPSISFSLTPTQIHMSTISFTSS
jgi:hypothetical protein